MLNYESVFFLQIMNLKCIKNIFKTKAYPNYTIVGFCLLLYTQFHGRFKNCEKLKLILKFYNWRMKTVCEDHLRPSKYRFMIITEEEVGRCSLNLITGSCTRQQQGGYVRIRIK